MIIRIFFSTKSRF